MGSGSVHNTATKELPGGNVLYLDDINANILIVTLHYNLTRCHHWEKLSEGHREPFCVIS